MSPPEPGFESSALGAAGIDTVYKVISDVKRKIVSRNPLPGPCRPDRYQKKLGLPKIPRSYTAPLPCAVISWVHQIQLWS